MDPEAIHIVSPQQAPEEKTGIINKLPSPKKPNLLIIFLVVIALIALATILYFANQINKLRKETTQTSQLQSEEPTNQTTNEDKAGWKTYNVESCGKLLPDPQISLSVPSSWKSSFSEKDYVAQHIINGSGGEKLTITCGDGLGGGCDNWGEIVLGGKTFPACMGEEAGIIYKSQISGKSNGIGFELDIQYPNTEDAENIIDQILSTFQFIEDVSKEGTINWENHSDISTWQWFNQYFNQNPERKFRFRYPSIFSISNVDSGSVTLLIDNKDYLHISEYNNNYPGDNFEEKYIKAYTLQNGKQPDYTILDFDNFIVYKTTETTGNTCGLESFNKNGWNCYLGEINGKGFMFIELITIPENIILNILESIEFN